MKGRAYSLSGGGEMKVLRAMYWGPNVGHGARVCVVGAVLGGGVAGGSGRAGEAAGAAGGAVRALLAGGLQLAIGQFNWFHRYEVYAVAFTVLVASTALAETTRLWRGVIVAGLLAVGFPYAQALWQTPDAASNVYQQQYQMHRFVADFYRKPVAVNDLGWVSYRRPAGVRVLDLWGLASPEASRAAAQGRGLAGHDDGDARNRAGDDLSHMV